MIYSFFDKKSSVDAVTRANNSAMKSEIISNQESAEKFHESIIRKFEKRKVYSSFKDNIWGTDIAEMQLISKYMKDFDFYYVLLIFIVNMYRLSF